MDIHGVLIGNLAGDPRLAEVSGTPVVEFRLIVNRRRQIAPGQWAEMEPRGFDVVAWGDLARHVAVSLRKGDRALVWLDDIFAEAWPDKAGGEPHRTVKVRASEVGPSLRFASSQTEPAEPRSAIQPSV
jgi:single-strand DNA-binding protein